jgi:hypothetical protein
VWGRAAWAVLLLMLGYWAATKGADCLSAAFRIVSETKITAFGTRDPEVIVIVDKPVNKKLEAAGVYRVCCCRIEDIGLAIRQSIVSKIFGTSRANLNWREFRDRDVWQGIDQFGLNIEADICDFSSALAAIPDFVAHRKLLTYDQTALELKVLYKQPRPLALYEGPSLYASNDGKDGGEEAHYPRPPNHSDIKFTWFLLSCALVSSLLGVWSIAFWDGFGLWRYMISGIGWALMFCFLARALLFHD